MFSAASDIMFRCVFDECISMDSMEIERRPYHRNCNCALHKSKAGSSTSFPQPRNILFPKKQSWRDCSLSLVTYQPRVKQILAGPCYKWQPCLQAKK